MKKFSYSKHLRLWLATLAGCFILAAHAQPGAEVRIQGKVTDKQLNPIVGVVVAVQERQAGTTTASDGSFWPFLENENDGFCLGSFLVSSDPSFLPREIDLFSFGADSPLPVGPRSMELLRLPLGLCIVSSSVIGPHPPW